MNFKIGQFYEDGIVVSFDETTGKGLLCDKSDIGPMTWYDALMYQNKNKIGGFAPERFWSSSQVDYNDGVAWGQKFSDGYQSSYYKSDKYRARTVRDFVYREPKTVCIGDTSAKVVPFPEQISLRDWFAAMVMQGICTDQSYDHGKPDIMARRSYLLADAMLVAREAQ